MNNSKMFAMVAVTLCIAAISIPLMATSADTDARACPEYEELLDFLDGNDTVYIYINEEGDVDYILSKSVNAGRTGLEYSLTYVDIYLDSDLCYALASIGLGALTLVPGLNAIAAILTVAGIGTAVIAYIDSNYTHINNGIIVRVSLFNTGFMGIPIPGFNLISIRPQ